MKTKKLCAILLATAFVASACSSDSVEGDPDYGTDLMLTTTLADGTKMFFLDQGNGTVAVTYDHTNPRHVTVVSGSVKAQTTDYTGNITVPEQVTIDSKTYRVTAVSEGAFCNATSLTSVVLPESVTTIGEGAFTRCTSLVAVNIPSGVTTLPEACFGGCSKLATVTLPDGLTEIGRNAFYNCSKIVTLELPANLKVIGQNALTRCTGIKELTLPATLTTIGNHPFLGDTKLTKLHMKATTPVQLGDALTDNTSMTVFVPAGSKQAYAAADYWKELTIEEE